MQYNVMMSSFEIYVLPVQAVLQPGCQRTLYNSCIFSGSLIGWLWFVPRDKNRCTIRSFALKNGRICFTILSPCHSSIIATVCVGIRAKIIVKTIPSLSAARIYSVT